MQPNVDEITTIWSVVDRGSVQLRRIAYSLRAFGTIAATFTAVSGVKAIIEATSAMEGYQARLTTMLGTQKEVNKELSFLKEFALHTPYDLQEVIDAFTELTAYGLKPTAEQFRIIGNFAASMGKSFTDAVVAVERASQGQFRNLRTFGLSKAEIASFGQNIFNAKGQMTDYAKFMDALFKAMDARSKGAMERLSQTIPGKWSNIKEKFFLIAAEIGKGIEKPLLNILTVIDRVLNNLIASGLFERIAKWLAHAFSVDHMKTFVEFVVTAALTMQRVFTGLKVHIDNLVTGLQVLKLMFNNIILFGKYIAESFNFTKGHIQRMHDIQGEYQGNIQSEAILRNLIANSETKEAKDFRRDFLNIQKNAHSITDKLFKGLNDKPMKFGDVKPAYFGNRELPESGKNRLLEAILGGGELARIGVKATQLGGRVIGHRQGPIEVRVETGAGSDFNKAFRGLFETFLAQAIKQGKVSAPGHT